MKLNLECGNSPRNGYVNTTMFPSQITNAHDGLDIRVGSFMDLGKIIEPNQSVAEIIFNPLLNVLTPNNTAKCLSHWKEFLIPSGTISVSCIDAFAVANKFCTGEIDITKYHEFTIGTNANYQCVCDIDSLRRLSEAIGLKVNNITKQHCFMTLVLKK